MVKEKEEINMKTPIADFVKEYAKKKGCRFHMPGHKGRAFLGCEPLDITEIAGADALYEAEGIIAESENNATKIFGTKHTFFSTEGSSQCIRAMMQLAVGYQKENEKEQLDRPYVIAARNAHKAFLYAAALVDFDVVWLYPEEMNSLCSCKILPEELETELKKQVQLHQGVTPAAVYVTSPDYLGGQLDILSLSKICHKYHTIFCVDNAHGAYLHFLEIPMHPIDLGADLCCDSAHKTLPVLTGGAYLQIHKNAPAFFEKNAKQALALFGSTSPSYLTMASLDLCNAYLDCNYREKLADTIQCVNRVRKKLKQIGWKVEKTEPLKLTIETEGKVDGRELAGKLREEKVECEYADADYLVFMVSTENEKEDYAHLLTMLEQIYKMYDISGIIPKQWKEQLKPVRCEQKCSIREAIFSKHKKMKVEDTLGYICAAPTVGCPPAIPVVVSGEEINIEAIRLFQYYGIKEIEIVSEK